MASPDSCWRLYTQDKIHFNSSATVSAVCAEQCFPGSCPVEHTRGSSIGHELDFGSDPEALKTSEPSIGHCVRPGCAQFSENMTADVQYAMNKCESLSSGKQLILHGNPSAIAQDVLPAYGSSSTSVFCRICTSSAV